MALSKTRSTASPTLRKATQAPELIHLNVGGEHFTTTRETLCASHARSSMLSRLIASGIPTQRDQDGNIFLDRDGYRFRIVLNYLRCGTIHVVGDHVPCPGVRGGFVLLEEVLEEARFYGLDGLVELIENQIRLLDLETFLEEMLQQRRGSGESRIEQISEKDSGRCSMIDATLSRSVKGYQFTLDAEF